MPEVQITIPLSMPNARVIDTSFSSEGDLIVTLEDHSDNEHFDELLSLEEIEIMKMLSLSQLSPNSSKHSFVKAMVHDLRNPLSIIIGFADMLVKDRHEIPEDKIDKIAKEILKAGNRMDEMLKTISRWARQDNDS